MTHAENRLSAVRKIHGVAYALTLFLAMRHGAPENPGVAGAIAGLVSAGIAGTLYASNCLDDSPLLVAIWYPVATLMVTAVGFFAGRRWLRW